MARDVEQTRGRIREAAIAEFAEYGEHGTTIERIAGRAGVNRERIYHYFGDKAALFGIVVREEVEKVAGWIPSRIESIEHFKEIAGRNFDHHLAHPDLARLVAWEGLTDGGAVAEELGRSPLYKEKVETFAAAQREGLIDDTIDPDHLLFLFIALASYWDVAPHIARMLSGVNPGDPDEQSRRRAAVVEATLRLALPRGSPDSTG